MMMRCLQILLCLFVMTTAVWAQADVEKGKNAQQTTKTHMQTEAQSESVNDDSAIMPEQPDYVYKKLEVAVSSAELIRFDEPLSDIFVADSDVADVTVNSINSFYIQAGRPGRTTIIGYDHQGGVSVLFDVHVVVDTKQLEQLIAAVEPEIEVEATATPQGILLRGTLDSPEQAEFIEQIALQYLSSVLDSADAESVLINQMRVNAANQVNLQVRVAEVSRRVGEYISINLGFEDTGGSIGFGGATGVRGEGSSAVAFNRSTVAAGVLDSLLAVITKPWGTLYTLLDLLEDEGLLVTLAQPNLTTTSGESAEFFAGGEVPVPGAGGGGAGGGGDGVSIISGTVEFKEIGVRLDFTPTILSSGRISLNIEADINEINESYSQTINGNRVPGTSERTVSTVVEVASGQNFAIAGLLQNRMSSGTRQFPGLADIPILGALFRSDSFQNSETELVIIVTPLLVEPVSQQALVSPAERYSFNSQLERWLTGRIMEYQGMDMPIEQVVMAPRYLEIGGFMLE